MTSVRLPDGSFKEFDKVVTVRDVAKSIGSRLAKDALWGEIDMQPVELDFEIPTDETVNLKIVTKKSDDALETLRHSCAHIMARAMSFAISFSIAGKSSSVNGSGDSMS